MRTEMDYLVIEDFLLAQSEQPKIERDDSWQKELSNLHEIALSRSIERTLHELQRLQAARAGEYVAAPEVVDVNINGSLDGHDRE